MSDQAEAGGLPLPAGAVALLEAFRRSHQGADVRLWTTLNGARVRLFPGEEPAMGGAAQRVVRHVAPKGGAPLELEVGAGAATDAELDFLADALAQLLGYEREARLAAQELAERYEEINLLYSISEILGSVLSLRSAARRILSEVTDVMGARRASLWVYDAAAKRLDLAAAVGVAGLEGPIPVDDVDSVTARVFRERQPLNVERGGEAPAGTRLEPWPRRREPFLSVPINYSPPEGGTRTVGVITLVGRRTEANFSAGDARLLAAIASQVGAAIETHRLVEESLHQERLIRELELAHDLQLKLLPDAAQFQGTAQVAARCVPADSVGGDFYHLIPLGGDRLGVMIGDVSSHGFSAALIMALTISAVAIYAQEAGPPGEVLRRVHHALIDELESTEMYVTLFYGVLDPAEGRLIYSNAGHPHAFVVAADASVQRLGSTGPPLGTTSTADGLAESERPWRPAGDLLCLFTDGLSDAFTDPDGSNGEDNLMAEVVRLRASPPAEIVEHLFARARRARLAVPPDDRSAVLVRT